MNKPTLNEKNIKKNIEAWIRMPFTLPKIFVTLAAPFMNWIGIIVSALILSSLLLLFRRVHFSNRARKLAEWISEPAYIFVISGILVIYCYLNSRWAGLALLTVNLFWGDKIWGSIPVWIETTILKKLHGKNAKEILEGKNLAAFNK